MNKCRIFKKKKSFWLSLLFCFLFALTFLVPKNALSLSRLSYDFFFRFFQNETAKEVFALDHEEFVAVFGDETESVFL